MKISRTVLEILSKHFFKSEIFKGALFGKKCMELQFFFSAHCLMMLYMCTRAREIDKCKSVQPFHKQSAISVSFTETTDLPFRRSWKLPIGSFHNDRPFPNVCKECILTLNSIIFPSYTLFLVIYGFKKTVSNISDIRR